MSNQSNGISTNATTWIQFHLAPLFAAPKPDADTSNAATIDDASFQDAFAQTFSPACEVRHNHVVQPLQALKEALVNGQTVTTHASAVWGEELLSTNDNQVDEPTVVAGALVVTRLLPYLIRATPVQQRMYVHFSAKMERDESVPGDDNRRITSFYYTSVDKALPIRGYDVASAARVAQEGGSDSQ